MIHRRTALSRLLSAAVATVVAAVGTTASAQSVDRYPEKPVRIVVPVAVGGSTDVITRIVAERIGARMGQQFIVENRAGAGGIVGTEVVLNSAPDGYTLLMAYASFALSPHLFRTNRYDPLAFVPISLVASQPIAIVANPNFGPRSMTDLIAYGKGNPGKLIIGIATSGSSGHVALEQLKHATGFDATPVIYKSAAPNMTAVVSGEVPVSFTSLSAALPMAKAGRLRFIASLTEKRVKQAPDVPTAVESGVDLLAAGWTGLVGPPKMPQAIADKLYAVIAEVLREPATISKLEGVGTEVVGSSPADFAKQISREWNEFKAVVERSKMKPE